QVREGVQGLLQAGLPVRSGAALLGVLLRPRLHARRGDEEGRHGGRSRRREEGADVDDLRGPLEDPLRRARRRGVQLRRPAIEEGGWYESYADQPESTRVEGVRLHSFNISTNC